jgi:putative membrane protein insertion efficiency factor
MTRRLFFIMLAFYRAAKPLFWPVRCRYWPSCSAFAEEAVQRHGLRAGLRLAFKRIARCHPWGASGPDPVPENP